MGNIIDYLHHKSGCCGSPCICGLESAKRQFQRTLDQSIASIEAKVQLEKDNAIQKELLSKYKQLTEALQTKVDLMVQQNRLLSTVLANARGSQRL